MVDEKPIIKKPVAIEKKLIEAGNKIISRKATWSAAEKYIEEIIIPQTIDLKILSFANRGYDNPQATIAFYKALRGFWYDLRFFTTENTLEKYDKVFEIMRSRIYIKGMRNKDGNFDAKICDDLDIIYADLQLIMNKAQLAISYRKPLDLKDKVRSKLGLDELNENDNEDW